MDIVFVVDKRYFQYLNITIYTILKHNSNRHINFWVIKNGHFEINDEFIKSIENSYNFDIQYIDSNLEDNIYQNLYRPFHISTAAFNKFKIPELLPEKIERVLYLDCDVIVTDSLEKLFNFDLDKYYLAAVLDGDVNYAEKVGLSGDNYFNSGVMLLNLTKLREINLEKQAIHFLKSDQNPQQTSDQDAFNIVSRDNWLQLSDEWNYMMHKLNNWDINTEIKPKIIHYSMSEKPWSLLCDSPMREIYVSVLKELNIDDMFISQFELLKSKPVYIYTASNGAKIMSELLNKLSINYEGFIDSNKEKKSFLNKPVFSLDKLQEEIIVINASMTYALEIKRILESHRFSRSTFSNKIFIKSL